MTFHPVPKPKRPEKIEKPRKVTRIESNPLEEIEQQTVAEWLNAKGILYQASAMGAYLPPSQFNKLKKIGCKKSHPDIVIYTRAPKFPEARGIAIEMKRKKDSEARPDQIEYMTYMAKEGWLTFVCKGADQAIIILEHLGYGRSIQSIRQSTGPQAGE